jgi:hypothetical protein
MIVKETTEVITFKKIVTRNIIQPVNEILTFNYITKQCVILWNTKEW